MNPCEICICRWLKELFCCCCCLFVCLFNCPVVLKQENQIKYCDGSGERNGESNTNILLPKTLITCNSQSSETYSMYNRNCGYFIRVVSVGTTALCNGAFIIMTLQNSTNGILDPLQITVIYFSQSSNCMVLSILSSGCLRKSIMWERLLKYI